MGRPVIPIDLRYDAFNLNVFSEFDAYGFFLVYIDDGYTYKINQHHFHFSVHIHLMSYLHVSKFLNIPCLHPYVHLGTTLKIL